MANLYVSIQRGSDAYSKVQASDPSTPWATITKAVGEVVAGDTVYIGPGTYREKIVLVTAGAAGSIIRWIPDPQVKYVTGDIPGYVRITGNSVAEVSSTGDIWNFNAKFYNELGSQTDKMFVDGARSTYYNVRSTNEAFGTGLKAYNVHSFASGGGAFYYISCYDCVGIVPYNAGYPFDCGGNREMRRCIAIGGSRAFNFTWNVLNSIAIGSAVGFYGGASTGKAANCLAIGCGSGFHCNSSAGTRNNIAIGCATGFNNTGNALGHMNALALVCNTGFYGSSTSTLLNTTLSKYLLCASPQRTTGWPTPATKYETDEVLPAQYMAFDFTQIISALMPIIQNNFDMGDNTAPRDTYDLMGHERLLGDGAVDLGPYEVSKVSIETVNYKTKLPAIKIERAGMQRFVFWAKGGVEFSKYVWVKWENVTGDKPQLIIDSPNITRTAGTATGDGTVWEQITVTATPTSDGEISLFLYARDTGATAVVYFSDIE